jgi:flagellar biosynthesis/type III secretory pathway protein FliH
MARVTRARIVTKVAAPQARLAASPTTIKRVAREELAAREAALRIVGDAESRANALIEEARARATGVAEAAAREAAEIEHAKLAAHYLALQTREERAAETELDRSVQLAQVLAERLVGEALRIEPQTIAKLAQQALAEARGARTVHIEAHPDDLGALEHHLSLLTIKDVASLKSNATLERGSLRLHTDLGTIDAHLRPQLERLAAALRDALR